MHPSVESFIREKQYVANVSPRTIELYRRCLVNLPEPAETTPASLKELVIRLRERGLSPAGANIVIRTCNTFLHWQSGSERPCGAGCAHPRIPRVIEPRTVMPTLTDDQVHLIAANPRPRGFYARRCHCVALTLLDTGARIGELLKLRASDIDLDNLVLKLDGKGRRQRLVPFSRELRKTLFRFIADYDIEGAALVFAARDGSPLLHRNIYRDIRGLCRSLGFEPPARAVHSFRHSFAVGYVRRGGSPFHLQRMLGHSTLEMTRRYCSSEHRRPFGLA